MFACSPLAWLQRCHHGAFLSMSIKLLSCTPGILLAFRPNGTITLKGLQKVLGLSYMSGMLQRIMETDGSIENFFKRNEELFQRVCRVRVCCGAEQTLGMHRAGSLQAYSRHSTYPEDAQ